MSRSCVFPVIACLLLLGGCTRALDIGVTTFRPASLDELKGYVLNRKPDFEQFKLRGPYAVTVHKDRELRLSATERIEADLYLSAAPGSAPLVILLHGLDNSKQTHGYQALHLASWGMHSLALQLPNNGPWIGNGNTLARVVKSIHDRPDIIDRRIDPQRIVLAGHSFGGSSVAVALALDAPAVGGILLDPAGVGRTLPDYLGKIHVPVMVLSSDVRVSVARNRNYFYAYMRGNVAELSIAGAAHEDAQFPLETALPGVGTSSPARTEAQLSFVGALASAAFSLGFTGTLDYAWSSFDDAVRSGILLAARRK
jgi:pimeloyl-ACP methyl ester carboxylesterase